MVMSRNLWKTGKPVGSKSLPVLRAMAIREALCTQSHSLKSFIEEDV
jgi:hypothetical protein